ncbi:unnamed protein product [Closterium sp. NIES-64]|nr:unnamed protein product [Closterium sp. NIES-64]
MSHDSPTPHLPSLTPSCLRVPIRPQPPLPSSPDLAHSHPLRLGNEQIAHQPLPSPLPRIQLSVSPPHSARILPPCARIFAPSARIFPLSARIFPPSARIFPPSARGGRWCLSPSQCRLRADTELGSTKGWPRPGDSGFESNLDSMGAGFQGMLSGDSSKNPYFYSWNMVVVLYCDGGVFAGVKGKALYDHSQPYYLSGRPILNSILGDLNNKGLKQANSVLLTGCSAGAIAVSMACDAMAQFHFPRTAKVKCLMDAGFFMDTLDITGQYSFRGIVQRMFRFHSMTAAADDDCRTVLFILHLTPFPFPLFIPSLSSIKSFPPQF